MSKLEVPDFKKFEGGEQFAIAELFRNLQKVQNASVETASHLAFLTRTLKPDQFSIILKLSIHPLIQLEIPSCLCNPGELKFARKDLSQEEAFEQHAVNIIFPHPYHPNLEKVKQKHPMRCLAAAVHYTLKENSLINSMNLKVKLQTSSKLNVRNFSLL